MTHEEHQSALELLALAKSGDAAARERMVCDNLKLVKFLVKRFLDRGREYDDLYQYGCLGLIKAIDRFDPAFGVTFSTYAVPVILGEIRRYLRDDGTVHVSRSIRENAIEIERFREKARAENGQDPTPEEICAALSMKMGDFLLALNALQPVRSLDAPVDTEGNLSLGDTLGDDPMAKVEKKLMLTGMLNALSQEERQLIIRRYFHSKTQTEIALEMGISQVQVSRLESKIIKRLRGYALEETTNAGP